MQRLEYRELCKTIRKRSQKRLENIMKDWSNLQLRI